MVGWGLRFWWGDAIWLDLVSLGFRYICIVWIVVEVVGIVWIVVEVIGIFDCFAWYW